MVYSYEAYELKVSDNRGGRIQPQEDETQTRGCSHRTDRPNSSSRPRHRGWRLSAVPKAGSRVPSGPPLRKLPSKRQHQASVIEFRTSPFTKSNHLRKFSSYHVVFAENETPSPVFIISTRIPVPIHPSHHHHPPLCPQRPHPRRPLDRTLHIQLVRRRALTRRRHRHW